MKSNKFQRRFYRDGIAAEGLHSARIIAKETDLQILTNKRLDKDFVEGKIFSYRWEIENYINKDRRFLTSLKPLQVELDAPLIIQRMAASAKTANVGPMATVAGVIAEFLGRDLLKQGYKDVIVENGGDIFLKTTRSCKIGIYAGRSKLWNKLRLKIMPRDTPIGICTSSGTIGHSLSFGCADSVIIISKSVSLADAVATATANRVKSKKDLRAALDFAKCLPGVLGVLIIIKDNLLAWGKIIRLKS